MISKDNNRRHSTTVIATVILTLGVLRALGGAALLYGSLRMTTNDFARSAAQVKRYLKLDITPPPSDILVTNALLLSAMALLILATGIALAIRSRRSISLILITIAMSFLSGLYYLLAALPVQNATPFWSSGACPTCVAIVDGLWIGGFVAVLGYLRMPATRREFGEGIKVVA